MHIYTQTQIYLQKYIFTHTLKPTYIYTYTQNIHMPHTHTCVHTHMHVYTHARRETYIHTHTHLFRKLNSSPKLIRANEMPQELIFIMQNRKAGDGLSNAVLSPVTY